MWPSLLVASLLAQDVAVPLKHKGEIGIWFTYEEAQRLNKVDLTAPLKDRKIELLEEEKTLNEMRIQQLTQAVKEVKPAKPDYLLMGAGAFTAFSLGILLGVWVK